jgi:hypothetical protein
LSLDDKFKTGSVEGLSAIVPKTAALVFDISQLVVAPAAG